MPDFNNFDDLMKYLKNNPDEVLKNLDKDYLNVKCPICDKEHKIKNLRNGKGLCEETGKEFKIELDIQE